MIRLWRDSTAPRRPGKNLAEQRRLDGAVLDNGLLEAEAELWRSAWKASSWLRSIPSIALYTVFRRIDPILREFLAFANRLADADRLLRRQRQ